MSSKIIPHHTEVYKTVMRSKAPELLMKGPARTSKTQIGIRKVIGLHLKHYGLQSGLLRANEVDIDDTIRQDIVFLAKYDFRDPRSVIKVEGGIKFHTLIINGGRCVLGGMNRPGRILGTGKDIIFFSQMEQSTPAMLQIINTRLAGDSANWRSKKGDRVYTQLLGDSNPDRRDHHLVAREQTGKMKVVKVGFEDNPIYYAPNGKRTPLGKRVMEHLDSTLDGVYHDRFFKGIDANMEGAVFEVPDEAIIDEMPDVSGCSVYNAMDFGMRAPNVCLWIAEDWLTGQVTVYRDYRKTRQNVISFGHAVQRIRALNGDRIAHTITDNDENRHEILRDQCKIHSEMVVKKPGSIANNIAMIQHAILTGKLKFYSGLRENRDATLVKNNKPLSIIDELYRYSYNENSRQDKPKDEDNDGIDALGYWFAWRFDYNDPVGFLNATLQRQRPHL